ncbi:hypothetical protein DL98DRAFT_264191 [Cadophora sp. DSE1049]|nr:hypothetical protein DL98DRAFT_264191 [Cadophora sp. DSE1049]
MMQDKRFCSQETGPLPEFDTSKQRITWFLIILEEKPVLCMLFIFAIYRSSIDMPFIYSDWRYGGTLDFLKEKLQKMIRLRLATLLNLIFRAKFNVPRSQSQVDTEKYPNWIRENIKTAFNNKKIKNLRFEVNDIPILQSWPKLKRPTPWWKHLGGEGAFDESDNEDNDEDDEEDNEGDIDKDGHDDTVVPVDKKRARGAKKSSIPRKRARHVEP